MPSQPYRRHSDNVVSSLLPGSRKTADYDRVASAQPVDSRWYQDKAHPSLVDDGTITAQIDMLRHSTPGLHAGAELGSELPAWSLLGSLNGNCDTLDLAKPHNRNEEDRETSKLSSPL